MPPIPHTPDLETRIAPVIGSLRVAAGDSRRIRGMAIVFNSISEILGGMFREKIAPEAVDRTLREGMDVRALVDHDPSKILGRTKAGTLRLDKTAQGLQVTIDPPDTTAARDILESVRRGDVTGMSFGFRTVEDKWDQKTDPPTRTLLDMEIFDVSIVSFPAYPDTSVGLRSLQSLRSHSVDSQVAKLRAKLEAPLPWESTERMIKQMGEEWCVFDQGGMKNLGCHPTKAKALEHLQAIEANK